MLFKARHTSLIHAQTSIDQCTNIYDPCTNKTAVVRTPVYLCETNVCIFIYPGKTNKNCRNLNLSFNVALKADITFRCKNSSEIQCPEKKIWNLLFLSEKSLANYGLRLKLVITPPPPSGLSPFISKLTICSHASVCTQKYED